MQSQAAGLDEVPQLVDQDQRDEADRDPPAPDQRIAADRHEEAGELGDREPVLRDRAEPDRDRPQSPLEGLAPVRAGMDRLVVADDLGGIHGLTVAGSGAAGSRPAPDPLLAAFVD